MRARHFLLTAFALGALAASSAGAAGKQPSCSDLAAERQALLQYSRSVTGQVEAKNAALGEAADSLRAAKGTPRREELMRRVEGLRRELGVLLDREEESVERLRALDVELAKRCGKGGRK